MPTLDEIQNNQSVAALVADFFEQFDSLVSATFLDYYNKLLIWVSREKDNNETAAGKTPALWVS